MSISYNNIQMHNRRAIKAGNVGSLTLEQYEVAYEYFGGRCAYSGETMPIDSLEHAIALCSGGDTAMWNCFPASIDRNLSKNGYHLLDWYENEGITDYNPYRLLKIINYMVKVLQNKELVERNNIEEMRNALILTSNKIDEYLSLHQNEIYSNESFKTIEELEELGEELELEDLEDDAVISRGKKAQSISVVSFLNDIIEKIEQELPETDKDILTEIKDYIEELDKDNFIEKNKEVHNEIVRVLKEKGIQRRYGVSARIVEDFEDKTEIEETINKRIEELENIIGKEYVNKLIVKNPDVLLKEYDISIIKNLIEQVKNTDSFKNNGMDLVILILNSGDGKEYEKKLGLLKTYEIKLDQSGMSTFLAFGTAKKIEEHISILQQYKRDDLIKDCKEIIKKKPEDIRRIFEIADKLNCTQKITERMLLRNPDEIEAKLEFLISKGLDIEDAGLATKRFCKRYGITEEVLKR